MTAEALRQDAASRRCHLPGCRATAPAARWACQPCWHTLPKNLRDAIWAAWNPFGEAQPPRYHAAVKSLQEWLDAREARKRPAGTVRLLNTRAFRVAVTLTNAQHHRAAVYAWGAWYARQWANGFIGRQIDARAAWHAGEGTPEFLAAGEPVLVMDHPSVCQEWIKFRDGVTACRGCGLALSRTEDGQWVRRVRRVKRKKVDGKVTEVTEILEIAACEASPWTEPGHRKDRHEPQRGFPWAGRKGSKPPPGRLAIPSGTIQAALADACGAWDKHYKSLSGERAGGPVGRPVFKRGRGMEPHRVRSGESFQVHGGIEVLTTGTRGHPVVKLDLPGLGTVRVRDDADWHPAMRLARDSFAARDGLPAVARPERETGNCRRSRQLASVMAEAATQAAGLAPLLVRMREEAGLSVPEAVDVLSEVAGERTRARAVAEATLKLASAQEYHAKALAAAAELPETATEKARAAMALRLARAGERAEQWERRLAAAQAKKAGRIDGWTVPKLAAIEKTGHLRGPSAVTIANRAPTVDDGQAGVMCDAYQASQRDRERVMALACQARVIRATLTKGSDGLWWVSVTAAVPVDMRVREVKAEREDGTIALTLVPNPSARQLRAGPVGVDLGVRDIMTLSDGTIIPNPQIAVCAQTRLRAAQRRLSKSEKGKNRQRKRRAEVGRLNAEKARLRADHAQKTTTGLVRRYAAVSMEGFNIRDMAKPKPGNADPLPAELRRDRNRGLLGAGLGGYRTLALQKALANGCVGVKDDAHKKTSATCGICGAETESVPQWLDFWCCQQCGSTNDRRLNSAGIERQNAGKALAKLGSLGSGP